MAVNTSRPEVDRVHPLLDAIAGFRDAINRLIDEQKAGLLNRAIESEADFPMDTAGPRLPAVEVAAAPRGEPSMPARAWTASPLAPAPRPESLPAPRPRGLPPEAAEPQPTTHADDPRQRLDALAKLLDKRRKPGGSTTVAPPGTVEESES